MIRYSHGRDPAELALLVVQRVTLHPEAAGGRRVHAEATEQTLVVRGESREKE